MDVRGVIAVILGRRISSVRLRILTMFELKPRDYPLKTLREVAGLSQIEVAKLTGAPRGQALTVAM